MPRGWSSFVPSHVHTGAHRVHNRRIFAGPRQHLKLQVGAARQIVSSAVESASACKACGSPAASSTSCPAGPVASIVGLRSRHEAAALHVEHVHLALIDHVMPAVERQRAGGLETLHVGFKDVKVYEPRGYPLNEA